MGGSCEYMNAIIFIGLENHFINISEGLPVGHMFTGVNKTQAFFPKDLKALIVWGGRQTSL